MAKNRVIYQSDALFVSSGVNSTGENAHAQLRRVQSANYSFNITRQDVNQFGQLSRIEAIILESPTVSFDASYYLGDGFNEEALGFLNNIDGGFVSGQIASSSGNNFYILTAPEGVDANFNTSGESYNTIGIGNAFLTDYTVDAAVGDIPTVSVSFEGSNMNATANVETTGKGFTEISGVGINPENGDVLANQALGVVLPAASQDLGAGVPKALRPGDITLSLSNAEGDTIAKLHGTEGAHVQSISLSIPLSRTPIDRLGSRFSFARVTDFPVVPTLSVSAIVNETQTQALTDIIADDGFISQLQFSFADSDGTDMAVYRLKNVKLDSESFSSSIGPNKTVDLTFSLSIGGPDDTDNNVFFSGANTDPIYS